MFFTLFLGYAKIKYKPNKVPFKVSFLVDFYKSEI